MKQEYHIEYKGLEKRKCEMEEEPKRRKVAKKSLEDLSIVASCMDEWTRTENSAYEKELSKRNHVIDHLNVQYKAIIAKYCVLAESVHDMAAEIQIMQRIIHENAPNYPLTRYIISGPYLIPQVRVVENTVPVQTLDLSDTDSEATILDDMMDI